MRKIMIFVALFWLIGNYATYKVSGQNTEGIDYQETRIECEPSEEESEINFCRDNQ